MAMTRSAFQHYWALMLNALMGTTAIKRRARRELRRMGLWN